MSKSKIGLHCRRIGKGIFYGMLFVLAFPLASAAETKWNVGVSGGEDGITGFNLSIGEYFRVPQDEVIIINKRGIPEYEMPVVFFLAQLAHVRPEVIVSMRLGNKSWMDITLHYGLSPEIYYVPVKVKHQGPPYGKAYGYYKKYPRNDWHKIRLSDDDVVNQVNLKFISEYHGYSPEYVMRYRSVGKDFISIDNEIRQEKYQKEKLQKSKDSEWKNDKGRGKGKDKDKGKDR